MLKSLTVRLNPLFLNDIRCVAAALVFVPFVLMGGGIQFVAQMPLRSVLILLGGTVINIGLAESLFLFSLRYIDLSKSYPISICGYPLVTLITAYFFLGEQVPWITLGGAILVLIGLYFTAFPAGGFAAGLGKVSSRERIGLALTIGSVIVYGFGTIFIKVGIEAMDLNVANFVRFGVIGLLLIPITFKHWRAIGSKDCTWRSVGMGAANGALALGLGGWIFLFALNTSGAAMTSVLTSTSPLFLLPLSIFFLKEKATRKLIVGVIVSVAGIILIFLPKLLG